MRWLKQKTKLPDGTTLAPLEVEMLRRVKAAAPDGFFHGETKGESWAMRRRALLSLRLKSLVKSTFTKDHPPKALWSLTKKGAEAAEALWPAPGPETWLVVSAYAPGFEGRGNALALLWSMQWTERLQRRRELVASAVAVDPDVLHMDFAFSLCVLSVYDEDYGGCFEGDAMEIELKPVVELRTTPPEERYLVRATDGRMTVFADGTVQFSAELHREVPVRLRCDRLHTFPALEAG